MLFPKSLAERFPDIGNKFSPEMEKAFKQNERRRNLKDIGFWLGILFMAIAAFFSVRSISLTKQSNAQAETIQGLQMQLIEQGKLIDSQQEHLIDLENQLETNISELDTLH